MDMSDKMWSPEREAEYGIWNGNLYDVNTLIPMIRDHVERMGWTESRKALDFALKMHEGQYRKNRKEQTIKVPYIIHPAMMTIHAWSLGWQEDRLTAVLLLHDVCEDCGVLPEELPVCTEVQEAVRLLSKSEDFYKSREGEKGYYQGILGNRMALTAKLLDRVHNISGMASGFSPEKLQGYVEHTRRDFYPMLDQGQAMYPEDMSRWFLLRYHMCSILESLRLLMESGGRE